MPPPRACQPSQNPSWDGAGDHQSVYRLCNISRCLHRQSSARVGSGTEGHYSRCVPPTPMNAALVGHQACLVPPCTGSAAPHPLWLRQGRGTATEMTDNPPLVGSSGLLSAKTHKTALLRRKNHIINSTNEAPVLGAATPAASDAPAGAARDNLVPLRSVFLVIDVNASHPTREAAAPPRSCPN